ncbi:MULTISPECIES: phosphate ABC transporter ATP-binding protein PstB [Spiroplasma]|uniref:Phosphate ABC transporter ATP-binding protein n=3 Tax=Spiroplasma TaxID=2132 RepID=A0AAI9X0G8_SPIME|nr:MULTISPECIES: phosphate ABC transporter ATP-binding protein PstB [Spiroplasma]APE74306.1 phosphate ABC transporter ATP-binding protein [Spiroplasma citri]ELL44300.1 phosphate ABC transporter ATP-binding protein [Spiroplasma melliferum IPMB4A]KAI92137.1 phosphate ABC transporter ATP-binding protein [Spiroplasma melliferum KC3]QCO23550.1 phosphate ABC transporter ATP-binding protein [Spiroplasma melliferum]QIA66530.1 phosphate ABC transporter ATP-binding protein [Spiroplasma citri]
MDPKVIIKNPTFDSSDNNPDLITVKNVDFFYKGNKQALFNISMKIKEHTVTAFIGSSGSGKSTLLRLFNRMNDVEPKSVFKGEILINGKDIYSPETDIVKLRTDIGMVFQKPSPFPMSIYDNVAYGPRNQGVRDRKLVNSIVVESLKRAALWDEVKDNLRDSAFALSGGQQQRLCIARAIAMKPKILLMDEPTSALDPISTSKIEELITQLKKDFTIVLVTHHMQQAARVADYTAFFAKGKLIEYNKTKIIFSRPANKKTEDYITGRFE